MERREIQERLCQLQSWGESSRAKERQDCIEVTARDPWWKPGSVEELEEQVGFLEEVRRVDWHREK